MAGIKPADMDVVRQVLTGKLAFDTLANEGRMRDVLMVAIVTLHASGETEFSKTGSLGHLGGVLTEFARVAGHDHPRYWRIRGVEMSKRLGLHKNLRKGDGHVVLTSQLLIDALLNEGDAKERAIQLGVPILAGVKKPTTGRQTQNTPADRWRRERAALATKWGVDIAPVSVGDAPTFAADLLAAIERVTSD